MIKLNHSGGAGLKGLIAGGILAGALGLAVSDSLTPYGSPTTEDRTMSPQAAPANGQANTSDPSAGAASDPSQASASQAMGWRIRVCSEKTKADNINFTLSSADKGNGRMNGASQSRAQTSSTGSQRDSSSQGSGNMGASSAATQPSGPETASWTRGESTVIPIPASLSNAQRIRVEATPGQKDQKASVCVLYKDHVVKKMNFDDREVSTVKSSQTGECGC